MSNNCSICNKDITLLGEEGCEDCGLEHDPTAPDRAEELDFNNDNTDTSETTPDIDQVICESLDAQLTAPWDADSDA